MLLQAVQQLMKQQQWLTNQDAILIACSGGIDSMVAVDVLRRQQLIHGYQLHVVYVDHQLREESAREGELVAAYCERHKLAYTKGLVHIPIGEGNTQNLCREARYTFFERVFCETKSTKLITAHHADDQLESVLMDLTKGRPPIGMPIRRGFSTGELIRPLFTVTKEMIQKYAEKEQVPYLEDKSNLSSVYLRNRIRQQIVPLLKQENPKVSENVVHLSVLTRDQESFLLAEAEELLQTQQIKLYDEQIMLSNQPFHNSSLALQRCVITLLLGYLYKQENQVISVHFSLIEQLVNQLMVTQGSVSFDLPHHYEFIREYDRITLRKKKQQVLTNEKLLFLTQPLQWNEELTLTVALTESFTQYHLPETTEVWYFEVSKDAFPLRVRLRQPGDFLRLSGTTGSKKVSRLLIDQKIPKQQREQVPILLTQCGEVLAVPTVRYGPAFSKEPTAQSTYVLLITKKIV